MRQTFIAVVLAFFAVACSKEEKAAAPVFHAVDNPPLLSDWGVLTVKGGALHLSHRVTPYDLATPLFSDYALKLRTVTLPEGESAVYRENDVFDFPVGTIITKTFYYPESAEGAVRQGEPQMPKNGALALEGYRLIETRILARRADGWIALPYVWNDEQTDAKLQRIGAIKPMTLVREDGRREEFSYLVPNQNQCAGCHATNNTTREIHPIGPKARHLNKPRRFAQI